MSSQLALALFLFVLLPSSIDAQRVACASGYDCWKDASTAITWVRQKEWSFYSSCSGQCTAALCNTGTIHKCDATAPMFHSSSAFKKVSDGLGFNCTAPGCWNGIAGDGQIWAKVGTDTARSCYFSANSTFDCDAYVGNANCYGERYTLVCPCKATEITSACSLASPPNFPPKPEFPVTLSNGTLDGSGRSCLARVNYWRKRACDEGWFECPPCGLPPMTECTCCHECANSQAEYDDKNGGHASFTRCGDLTQGVGGGSDCAEAIDGFVSERAQDANGTWKCEGHCGPILEHGCQTFFWGKAKTTGTYVFNWGNCPQQQCNTYCANPTSNECYASPASIAPNMTGCLPPVPPVTGASVTSATGPGAQSDPSSGHHATFSLSLVVGLVAIRTMISL